ncbi:efflux RND transporter permease subunit [Catalinimonas niigatensis]|uniref:efflux RND transporter permease subunit n=1 Tax=Catalinimonas niigatensis TaxID=1397264 RepID=UPI002665B03B|nr:efflux RND transporter permease subunit [Catalinimonas niigatensis]WPP52594.1 efflux RND transporter permease subunit [Catalinimonas niigatensis]
MKISEISVKRPTLIIVMFMVTVLAGVLSFPQIGYQLIPDIAVPTLTITTIYPGASPSEVENSVTREIENAVADLESIDNITSKSLESASLVIINFKAGTDIDQRVEEAQRSLNKVLSELPEDAESPAISKVSPSDLPIMQISASSNLNGKVFYKEMEDQIVPQLQQIEGVAAVNMLGGEEREIKVAVKPDKLEYYGVSLLQVTQAIGQANMEFPTGSVKSEGEEITVRLAGKFSDIEQIRNQIVASPAQGSPIRVKDVAQVSDGIKDTESIARLNGENVIALRVQKQNGANTVDVSEGILARLKVLETQYAGEELKFTVAQDESEFTLEAVEAVLHDLVIAIALVAAVMLFFLHSFRNALIVMVAIPVSLISTVAFMYLMGYTFNLMTLLAMSLVIGILVDDSIVVLENIYRHMEMGKKPWKAVLDGTDEIGLTALSITLVIVIVFIPVTMVDSMIADIFRQFSWTVAIATLFSLLVSFTLIPWLMSRFSRVTHLNPKNPLEWVLIQFEKGLSKLNDFYESSLKWTLNRKWVVMAVVVVLFAFTGWIGSLGIIGSEQFSSGDKGEFNLTLEYDKSTSVRSNNLSTYELEQWLLNKEEVVSVLANVGGPSVGVGSTGLGNPYISELTVKLVDKEDRSQSTEQFMIGVMEDVRGLYSGIKVGAAVSGMVQSGTAPIEITLAGADYEKLVESGQKLKSLIERTPGANDVKVSVESGKPEVAVEIDRDKMSELGLNIATVGATLQNSFAGNDDSEYRDGDYTYDIRVQLDAFDRQNPEDVRNIMFVDQQGKSVKLAQFASVTQTAGPSVLERKDRRPSVTVTAFALGVPSGTLGQNIEAQLTEADFMEGISYAWGGDIKQQNESFGALGAAFGISLILIYLILVALYDNFIYPLVVLFSIPVALIGSFLALALSASTLSVFAILGVIMLLGLVAKNAILIVDFTGQLKAEGMSTREAVIKAGKERLRPILMTTLAMVIGMLPIALAGGAGAEWKNAMAWVIIGGLSSSLVLTIYVVPVAYDFVDWVKAKLQNFSSTGKKAPQLEKAN